MSKNPRVEDKVPEKGRFLLSQEWHVGCKSAFCILFQEHFTGLFLLSEKWSDKPSASTIKKSFAVFYASRPGNESSFRAGRRMEQKEAVIDY